MRKDRHLLEDIAAAAERIAQFIDGMSLQDFLQDVKTRSAVERQLTIMGEAANRLPSDFKAKHAQAPWSRLVQLRNFYTHAYERQTPEEV